jgi:hypothetical protein
MSALLKPGQTVFKVINSQGCEESGFLYRAMAETVANRYNNDRAMRAKPYTVKPELYNPQKR